MLMTDDDRETAIMMKAYAPVVWILLYSGKQLIKLKDEELYNNIDVLEL